jgi:GT2 family glycosyltransferase
MKPKIDVSVVIVNYNTLQLTKNCIDSIFEKTVGVTFEIILVDNNSQDGSRELFENDVRIRYAYSPENMGFGRANNIGIAMSKGKYIFCLNSDTLLLNDALKIFFDYAESHDRNAIYGCWLTNEHGDFHSYSIFPSMADSLVSALIPYAKHIPFCHLQTEEYKTRVNEVHSLPCYEAEIILGAAMFIPYQAFMECGVFDSKFFLYFEESDLEYRFMNHGIKRLIIDGPKIIHYSGSSSASEVKNNRKCNIEVYWNRSRYYFFKKHCSKAKYAIFKFLFIILRFPVIATEKDLSWKDRKKLLASLL